MAGRPRKPPGEKWLPVRITLPPDLHRELLALAELSRRTVSSVAGEAIAEHTRRKLGRRRADLVPPRARPGRAGRSMPD